MKSETILVTPEIAARLMEVNVGNRPIRKTNVIYFESCLRSGNFVETHQGIAIQGDLEKPVRLLDGQHRLLAIVRTGIAAEIQLTEGVAGEAYENIDGGLTRSLPDRINTSPSEVAVASMFYRLSIGGRKRGRARPPAALIREIHHVIAPYLEYVPCRRRGKVSLAAFRCAWVCEQRDKGSNQSQAFQLGSFAELAESLNAVYRRQMSDWTNKGVSSVVAQFGLMINAVRMPHLKRVSIPRNPNQFASDVVSEVFPEIDSAIARFAGERLDDDAK